MKHLVPIAWLCLTAACTHKAPADNGAAAVPAAVTEGAGLIGTAPARTLPAPEFTAINSDGTTRDRDDLIGAPHVIWFFPISGTPG